MQLLKSKKLKLPQVFFVTEKEDIKKVPIGVPFIFGSPHIKNTIIRILEYEVLYQAALASGYPFNFKQILKDNGFKDIESFHYSNPIYMDFLTEGDIGELDDDDFEMLDKFKELDSSEDGMFKKYIKDSAVYVDIQKLKELNVFPVWLDKIEEAISTNIHNFATYNPNMYNKKLDGMYGGLDLSSPNRNLIIIDISGSIPKGVSSTCLALAKNLVETFYADLLITGSISTLYDYNEIHELDIDNIYEINGMNNDAKYFRALTLTGDYKKYKTAIVFGDNHSPCDTWVAGDQRITREQARKECRWEVQKLISFHTFSKTEIAGYADFFSPDEVEKIKDWVKYL